MNERQKLVQEQFLNNEEAVIKRLKQVYNQALKDIEKKTQALQDEINRLGALAGMTDDATEKARLLSMQQSKVYQKQYQDALKKQIGSVLDNMQVEEFKTVSEYLQKCYEDGFVGTMFDLQGQGIPLCFPMDQEAMVRAVQLDSKISQGLYSRLGEDVSLLKKKITAQISRGIATGMSFQQVAQQLAGYTNIGYNNAVRIARTEGHRIQVQGTMDACYKAKEKGADVVKQWDSTLDARTRDSHARVDGEIRELDKKFSNGLRFPGDPHGPAAEVVNCRCALLQRARWALDDDELQTLKDRAAYFGLDKSDNFDDFKKKYLKAAEKSVKMDAQNSLMDVSDYKQLRNYLKNNYDITIDKSCEDLDFETVKKTLAGVESVFADYPELADRIKTISTKNRGVMCCSGTEIYFNPQYYKDVSGFEAMCKRASGIGWWPPNSTPSSIGVHETGHAVESLLLSLKDYDYEWQRTIEWNEGKMSGSIVSQAVKNIKKTAYGKGKKQADLMKAVSGYGATKKQECFAEAFADVASNGENANPLSIEIKRLSIEKYNKLKGK